MSKIEFKEFVRKNPHLIDQVTSGKTSWQKLYEIFDLYGESSNIWEKYQEIKSTSKTNSINNFKDIINMIKGVDLNSVQKGLNSLDKAIEAFKGLIPASTTTDTLKQAYEPRPSYKYFED